MVTVPGQGSAGCGSRGVGEEDHRALHRKRAGGGFLASHRLLPGWAGPGWTVPSCKPPGRFQAPSGPTGGLLWVSVLEHVCTHVAVCPCVSTLPCPGDLGAAPPSPGSVGLALPPVSTCARLWGCVRASWPLVQAAHGVGAPQPSTWGACLIPTPAGVLGGWFWEGSPLLDRWTPLAASLFSSPQPAGGQKWTSGQRPAVLAEGPWDWGHRKSPGTFPPDRMGPQRSQELQGGVWASLTSSEYRGYL